MGPVGDFLEGKLLQFLNLNPVNPSGQIGSNRSFLAHRKQLLALARVLSGLRACNQDLRSQGWKEHRDSHIEP